MGVKRYKGPVHTLEQAMFADFPVRITCAKCGHFRQMHAFAAMQLLSRKHKAEEALCRRPWPVQVPLRA